MSKRTYFPGRGDLVEVNFFPAAGSEIDKRRPAVILSPLDYNKQTGLCIAVPTSTQMRPGPLWIPMPVGLLPQPSMILCDYVKSFDYRERGITSLNKQVDRGTLDEIVNLLMNVIDPVYR